MDQSELIIAWSRIFQQYLRDESLVFSCPNCNCDKVNITKQVLVGSNGIAKAYLDGHCPKCGDQQHAHKVVTDSV